MENFSKLPQYDFTDFFLHLANRYLGEFSSVHTNKYLQVIAQIVFGYTFTDELDLNVTSIQNEVGSACLSLNQENECYVIAIGTVNEALPSSINVHIYAFTIGYLNFLFNTYSVLTVLLLIFFCVNFFFGFAVFF